MGRGRRQVYRVAGGVRINDCSPSCPLHPRLEMNPVDATGLVMLRSWCNSWLHLVKDCPDRGQFNQYFNADNNYDPAVDEHHNDDPNQALANSNVYYPIL